MTPTHGGRSVRRILTIAALAAIVVLAVLPGAAAAAPAQRYVDTVHGTRPPRITTEAGSLDFSITFSDRSGPRGEMAYWPAGRVPGEDFGFHGIEGFTTVDGDRLVGEYMVLNTETGEFAGFATYALQFMPSGPPQQMHETRQEGNLHTEIDTTHQIMAVAGTFTLPDGTTFPVASAGAKTIYDVFTNDPASAVLDGSETFIRATWNVDGTEIIFSFIETEITSISFVFVYDGGPEISGVAFPRIVDGRVAASYDLERSGRIPVGSASVDAVVTTLASHTYFEVGEGYRQRITEDEIAVRGSIAVTIDGETTLLAFADGDVFTRQQTWHGIQRPMKDDGGGEG